jgi:hypothetical protein
MLRADRVESFKISRDISDIIPLFLLFLYFSAHALSLYMYNYNVSVDFSFYTPVLLAFLEFFFEPRES